MLGDIDRPMSQKYPHPRWHAQGCNLTTSAPHQEPYHEKLQRAAQKDGRSLRRTGLARFSLHHPKLTDPCPMTHKPKANGRHNADALHGGVTES